MKYAFFQYVFFIIFLFNFANHTLNYACNKNYLKIHLLGLLKPVFKIRRCYMHFLQLTQTASEMILMKIYLILPLWKWFQMYSVIFLLIKCKRNIWFQHLCLIIFLTKRRKMASWIEIFHWKTLCFIECIWNILEYF